MEGADASVAPTAAQAGRRRDEVCRVRREKHRRRSIHVDVSSGDRERASANTLASPACGAAFET
jgi:hypothetical protein